MERDPALTFSLAFPAVCKGTPRFSGGGGGGGGDPSPGGPTPPEGLAVAFLLGMGCFTFVALLALVILWHSPLVAN